MKTTIRLFLAFLCLSATGFEAQAVSPPPDGGYPGANTAEGQNALLHLTSGGYNTAAGFLSLGSNATGSFNTAVGAGALLVMTGADPTSNGSGWENTATGAGALLSNTGGQNTANGAFALSNNTTGYSNSAFGYHALSHNTTGGVNIAIGNFAGDNVTTANGVICIGNQGQNVSGCYIGQIYGATIDPATAALVGIDSTGKLGTVSSSRRFKHDIKPMDTASEAVLALKPVTFHYKSDAKSTPCFGLIAEQVAEVNPDLVVRDEKGEIYTGSLRPSERDVAQRVPQRAPQSAGAGSDHQPTKVNRGLCNRKVCKLSRRVSKNRRCKFRK